MKQNFLLAMLVCCVFIGACSKGKNQSVQLEPGTDEYLLAETLAEKLPYFEPDANNVLAEGKDLKITTGSVIQQIYLMFGKSSDRLLSMPEAQLRNILQSNLDNLIHHHLLMNQIDPQKISIEESELDSIMQLQYAQMGGEEQFLAQLEQNNIAIEKVIADIKSRLLINVYLDEEFGGQSLLTEQEVLDLYEQDKTASVQHILFLTQGKPDSAKQEIRKHAEEVLAMAKAGDDFSELAKEYSEDPGSKDNGGLYEDFKRGDMVKPFEDASFELPIGSISDLVETQYGYHIVKVVGRKKETRPLEEIRNELTNQMEKKKKQELFEKHLDDLKAEAAVEYAPF